MNNRHSPKQMEFNPGNGNMKEEDLVNAVKILITLRIAISHIRLYPSDSSIIENSILDVFGKIQNSVTKYGHLSFAEVSGNILVNGNVIKKDVAQMIPRDVYEAFVQTLVQSHIKSLSFKKGITLEQFSFFLKIFSEKHWRREGDMMVLTAILKEKDIHSIRLNEKVYKAVGSGDIVIDKGMDYLERSEGELDSLMKSIEEIVEMSVFDEKGHRKNEVRQNVVNKILNLNPDLLVKFFERKKEPPVEEAKQDIIENLPPRHIKEIVARVIGVYKEIKKNAAIGSKKEQELLKLRETINGLLSCCTDKDTVKVIFRDLKEKKVDELLPPWWNRPDKTEMGLKVSKARLLMEKDALELLTSEVKNEFSDIIKEMDSIGKNDIVRGLLEKLKENFRAHTGAVRLDAARFYRKIRPVIAALSSGEFTNYLNAAIYEVIEKEVDSRVYREFADILIDSAREAVKEYDYERAQQILGMFRKHRHLEKEGFVGRNAQALDIMHKAASSDILKLLINDLRSREHSRQINAYKVLVQMEEFITPEIIESIKKTPDLGLREIMASVIRKIGTNAVLSLISEIEKNITATSLIRIIEILPTLQSDSLSSNKLYHTINHQDSRVRIQTLRTVLLLKDEKNKLLRYALDDDSLEVRKLAIQFLGELEDEYLFHKMARKKKSLIEERLFCEALARINLKECNKYLINIAGPESFWQKKRPREVRIAAIRALENHPSKETVGFLEKKLKSKDRYITSNAEYVLEKLKA